MPGARLVVAATLLLNACTQLKQVTGTENCDESSLSQAERQICKDNSTFNQTVAGGAVLGTLAGAATGALACAIAGKSPLTCAAIGAGVGLFAGGVTGYVVAKKQEAAKSNMRAIDSVTADVEKQNQALQSEVIAARQVAREGQQKLARVNAAVRNGTMSAEQAQTQRASVANDSKNLEGIINHMEEQRKNFQDAGQQVNESSAAYQHQLADMQNQITALKQQKDALDRAMSASG